MKDQLFWCFALKPNRAFTPRHFLGVNRSGAVIYPVTKEDLLDILAAEDTSTWKDQ